MQLHITTDGQVRCIYGETIDLNALGQIEIRRASHVEPTVNGHWSADLGPMNGPVLGPFVRRSDALAAEQQWLEEHWIGAVD